MEFAFQLMVNASGLGSTNVRELEPIDQVHAKEILNILSSHLQLCEAFLAYL